MIKLSLFGSPERLYSQLSGDRWAWLNQWQPRATDNWPGATTWRHKVIGLFQSDQYAVDHVGNSLGTPLDSRIAVPLQVIGNECAGSDDPLQIMAWARYESLRLSHPFLLHLLHWPYPCGSRT